MGWDTQVPRGTSNFSVARLGSTLRSGTTAQNATYVGTLGEITHDFELGLCHAHDGVTMGGSIIAEPPPFIGALVRPTELITPNGETNFEPLAHGEAVYDTHGFWSAANPTRLTIPVAAVIEITEVQLSWNITWTDAAPGPNGRGVRMSKNGNTQHDDNPGMTRAIYQGITSVERQSMSSMTAVMAVVPGDWFDVQPFHNHGAPRGVETGGDAHSWFSIHAV